MLIICNPIAGNGQGGKIFSKVCKLLRKNRISWDFKETRYEGEAEEISRKAVNEKKHKRILVIGGDGTINEVIQPLVKTDIDLGIIPAGTGNDFAFGIGVNNSAASILQTAGVKVFVKQVDVGCIEMPEYDFTKYFENIFGIGFDAKVVREFRRMKFNQSKFCYFLVAIQEIFNYKEVTLKMNGVESDFFEIVIGNGKREGGLFKISKQPNPLTDNSLDLTVIRSASKIKRIFYILTATLGMLQNCKEVEYKKITDIELETKDSLLTHIDGSLLFLPPGKIKVSVVPKALKVIQPAVI